MKKTVLSSLLMIAFASPSFAQVSEMCAGAAKASALAIADVNGTASETVDSAKTTDGKTFKVVLKEKDLSEDTYVVKTTGGDDCFVQSVKVKGSPKRRP